ncbi:MAG: phosphoribosylanthranilate isomerase [Mariprofundales bacterium]
MVRIKVCGITRKQDALLACELGVDALGFVFYKQSPRYISPLMAANIIRAMPPFITAVGLFVNHTQNQIDEVLAQCPLDVLQLHGNESSEFCQAQTRRVIKALPIANKADVRRLNDFSCSLLLDAKAPAGVFGGTGTSFDWSLLQGVQHNYPLILAGGLCSANITKALNAHSWWGVDVSSGVELSPGIKDANKMQYFINQVIHN